MSNWTRVKLGEVCMSIVDGDHQSMPISDSGIPFITISDIKDNRIDFAGARFVPVEYYAALDDTRKPSKGSVLYSVKGSFGIPVYVDSERPFTFQRDIAIMKCKTELNPHYLYYILNSQEYYRIADSLAIGSAQRALTLKTLRNLEIPFPDNKTQQQIVNYLSAYDDLIETNQRQIKLLEEAAQRLYKEWFVDLRFPGHENVPVVDGVPERWSVKPIGHIFKTVLGGTPSRANTNYWGGTINWINSGETNRNRIIHPSEFITELGLQNSSTKLMPRHTTVLAITGATLGQVSYTEIETCANQSVVGIIDETGVYSIYIYMSISEKIDHIIGKATGGAQQHINKDIVNDYPLLLPPKDVITMLNMYLQPIFEKIASLLFQNLELTEARDRLLPQLMSGEITV